uniref:Uncharacterized protein n=1 Tax=Meloidogyne enterolobii TaxID=390850 RepID=A0A6V7TJS5_MELEN|nr:unnamed protein product [Meloidogyne enterolobii]
MPKTRAEAKKLEDRLKKGVETKRKKKINNYSMFATPLLSIPSSQIIPPSFHLIQGISQRIIDAINDYCQHSKRSIQNILKNAHAKMDPRKQNFTGAALHRLITGQAREEFKKILPPTQSSAILCRMLETMADIYKLADASFLDQNEVEQLKKATTNLYNDIQALRDRFENLNFRGRLAAGQLKIFKPTPKLHMLCAHATEFAEQNGWWSWISEQGMEHLHSLYNYLAVQYCNTGDKDRTAEKLAQHQTLLNGLNDRGAMKKII